MDFMPSKYDYIFANENVRRWYENVSRGSRITGDVYLRRLAKFCEVNHVSPMELTELGAERIYNLLLDAVSAMERKQFSGGYIALVLKAIKSWLAFNGLEVKRGIKIRGARETPTLHDERVPTQEELRSIFLSGDEKARVVCALLAHSGLRLQVQGNYDGTDGLRVRDFPEIEVKGDEVLFKKIPTMIRVRSTLSKTAHEYFTFLGKEGCEYLKAYLEMQIRDGERIDENSPVVSPKTARKEFIRAINVGDVVRKAMKKAGFKGRPYVLRSYFDTQMMLAESKGLIIRDYRSFFMGHKGDIEAVYTVNKRRLPPDVIEQMRECYSKAYRYLQTTESGPTKDELTNAFKRQLLLVAGFKAGEVKNEHLELDEEKFHELVREKLLREVRSNHASQRVVAVSELERQLREGWQFVGLLPNDKAIVKRQDVA